MRLHRVRRIAGMRPSEENQLKIRYKNRLTERREKSPEFLLSILQGVKMCWNSQEKHLMESIHSTPPVKRSRRNRLKPRAI